MSSQVLLTREAGSILVADKYPGQVTPSRHKLAGQAIASIRHGRDILQPSVNLDLVTANQYGFIMAVNLSNAEVDVVHLSTGKRERGLALCRSGKLFAGAVWISEARKIIEGTNLGHEAFLIADSFQSAAEAFLHYKRGHHDAARTALMAALVDCKELKDCFGYPVEGQRVHLVRNIARVEVSAENYVEAARLACCMLNRLDSDVEGWPYLGLELASTPEELTQLEKCVLADQILGVISRIAYICEPDCRQLLANDFPFCESDAQPESYLFRARVCLDGILAYADDDCDRFLVRCAQFFYPGPQYFETAWMSMLERLVASGIPEEFAHAAADELFQMRGASPAPP